MTRVVRTGAVGAKRFVIVEKSLLYRVLGVPIPPISLTQINVYYLDQWYIA